MVGKLQSKLTALCISANKQAQECLMGCMY